MICSLLLIFQILKLPAIFNNKMPNSSQVNSGTMSAATTVVAHNRSTFALVSPDKCAMFSRVNFKKFQHKMLFYLTASSLQRFINENVLVMSDYSQCKE